MPTLKWQRSDGGELTIEVAGREVTIGRDPSSTVRVNSAYVSKHHAAIRFADQGHVIVDLGSSNGTRVNGKSVTVASLKPGDIIEIGTEKMLFTGDAHAAAAPQVRKGSRVVMVAGLAAIALLAGVTVILMLPSPSRRDAGTPVDPGKAQPATTTRRPATAELPAQPAATAQPAAPAQAEQPSLPVAAAQPSNPAGDPGALYDMAMAHIRGGRLVDARHLLVASLQQDPGNASARQRLREVDAAIQVVVDQHFTSGQRAFTYLRFDDAIREWEQVVGMTDENDSRHRQALAGIEIARARLVQPQ